MYYLYIYIFMDNLNYLNSTNNKEFLWNLLYEKKVFNNIPNNMLNNTKQIFENSIKNSLNFISENKIENNTLINLNKILVKNLNDDFINFKSNLLKSEETKNSLKNEKIELFNSELEKQKQNMDDVLILKKPDEIDFSDKKLDDKPIDINSMNDILKKMEKERNIILNDVKNKINSVKDDKIFVENKILNNNIIMNKIEEHTDIINNNNDNNDNNNNNNNNNDNNDNNINDNNDNNNKEKISNLEDLLINKSDFKKRNSKVNFKDLNLVVDNEYKYENITNLHIKIDNIYKTINKILENQEKIMKKLEI